MAEYIEREALIEEIEKNIKTYWNEGSGGYYLAEDALNYSVKTAPAADVVPKSEVAVRSVQDAATILSLQERCHKLENAKAEVAIELIEHLENEGLLNMTPQGISELKKKYTGEET